MPSDGLAGTRVNFITEDSEGYLWIATDNGVSKFDGVSFTNYRTQNGLLNNYVTSIVEFEPGLMVFGTDEGLSIFQNGSFIASDINLGGKVTPPYQVLSLGVDGDGYGWIGTFPYGLWITEDGTEYFQVWDSSCNDCNIINYIYLDSQDNVWLCTEGDLESYDGSSWQRYNTANGMPNNSVQSVFEDSWGEIWAGTYDGLAKKTNNSFEEFSLYNSAQQNWAYTLNQDSNYNLWIGSIGHGLVYFDGTVMRTEEASLNDKRLSTISSFRSSDGALWFGTFEGGLWKYSPSQ